MSEKHSRNTAASVRQRLLNLARERGIDFGLMLTNYAIERFLYRLGISQHECDFVIKGAVLFRVWSNEAFRPTRDLDMLALGSSELTRVEDTVREICEIECESDGVVFSSESVRAEEIREADEYDGVRVRLVAYLAGARIPVQIDIGFGDIVFPAPVTIDYPVLLDLPAPRLRSYPMESVISEKFFAMVSLGLVNSRLKDYFDIYKLAKTFEFDGALLSNAIRATFDRRGTTVPDVALPGLDAEFCESKTKQEQWQAFVDRAGLSSVDIDLAEIVGFLRTFLLPPMQSAYRNESFAAKWSSVTGWVTE